MYAFRDRSVCNAERILLVVNEVLKHFSQPAQYGLVFPHKCYYGTSVAL